jgi:hypothetical protein
VRNALAAIANQLASAVGEPGIAGDRSVRG